MRRILLIPTLLLAGPFFLLASVDSDLLAMVPSGSKLVASVDVARARSSSFGQYLLNRINTEDDDFEQFIRETGFDPRSDLQDFVIAGAPGAAGDRSEKFIILARGNFDRERIEASGIAKGGVVQKFEGFDIVVANKSKGNQTGLAFPAAGIAMMGDLATVQDVLRNRSTPSVLDAQLQQQIDKSGRDNDAWFAALNDGHMFIGPLGGDAKQPMQGAKALQSVLQSAGGMRFGDTVEMSFDAVTRSPQDAVSLTDLVRFGSSMAQMQRQKDPRAAIMASALDNMTLTASGNSVHMALSMAEKDVEQLAQLDAAPHHTRH